MNKYHTEILEEIKALAPKRPDQSFGKSYFGTTDYYYGLKVPEQRDIAKNFKKKHPSITFSEYITLINSLLSAKSIEEKTIAGRIVENYTDFKRDIHSQMLERWLNGLDGWVEIDSFCYGLLDEDLILSDWKKWSTFVTRLANEKNLNKHRASLVLLVKPVRTATDERVPELAFQLIDTLKGERAVLVTKAISWLLRELVKLNKKEVKKYLKKNKNKLPAIAVRETSKKIETGKK